MKTTTAAAPWTLRCLSGPMRGRSFALAAGPRLAGSTIECDVLVAGAEVRARHARFEVGEIAVSVEPVGGAPLELNGKPVDGARRGLVDGDVLALGDVAVELRLAAAPSAVADADDFLAGPPTPPPVRSAPPARRIWAVFGAGFVVSLGLVWWALGPGTGRAAAPGDAGARLERIAAEYPEVQMVAAGEGRTGVVGFVESALRLQALQRDLAPLGDRAALRVQVVEQVVDQARRFIAEPSLAVNYAGRGRLVVSGATESALLQARIRRLAEDLHPAVLVSDQVHYKPAPPAAAPRTDAQALWDRWQELLPARIVSMTDGPEGLRHIQLANGERYYEGALLKSGARLDLPRPDDIVMTPEAAR